MLARCIVSCLNISKKLNVEIQCYLNFCACLYDLRDTHSDESNVVLIENDAVTILSLPNIDFLVIYSH